MGSPAKRSVPPKKRDMVQLHCLPPIYNSVDVCYTGLMASKHKQFRIEHRKQARAAKAKLIGIDEISSLHQCYRKKVYATEARAISQGKKLQLNYYTCLVCRNFHLTSSKPFKTKPKKLRRRRFNPGWQAEKVNHFIPEA